MMSNKMKLIIFALLITFTVLECRTKSKNQNKNKWFRGGFAGRVGGIARPAYGGFGYRSYYPGYRRYYPGYYYGGYRYRPWWSTYWRPYFSYSWLYGIPSYSNSYIISNRKHCSSICDDSLPTCTNVRAKVSSTTGNLECVCKDTGNAQEFPGWCWTPRSCVRATSAGCEPVKSRIMQRIEEQTKRR